MGAAVLAVAGCGGGEREAADASIDAFAATVIRVARDGGDDASDGVAQPVATLRRAITLANQQHAFTTIELAAGTYQLDAQDSLPLQFPPNIRTVMGPPGGGAVIVGKGLDGLVGGVALHRGRIQDLEFDNFSIAIESSQVDPAETVTIANVRVTNSLIAIESGLPGNGQSGLGKLQIDNLEVSRAGVPMTRCAVGVRVEFTREVVINGAVLRDMGIAIAGPFGANVPPATITVTGATISATGDLSVCNAAALELGASRFTLSDSTIEGGFFGMNSYGQAIVTIKDSTIRNQAAGFIGAGTFQLTNTTLSNISSPVIPGSGSWSFDGVTISNCGVGLDLNGGDRVPLTAKVRRSKISGSRGDGIKIVGPVEADLGTAADPGNNIFVDNGGVGLTVGASTGGAIGPPRVTAAGNTWNPQIQGADGDGHYILVETLSGPIAAAAGNNVAVAAGISLTR